MARQTRRPCKCVEPRTFIVAQVPDLGANRDLRSYPICQCGRAAECRFLVPAEIVAGCLRLVEQVEPEIGAIFQKFEIGVDFGFQPEVCYVRAAGFIYSMSFRFD